jgi:hypothetical protein
MTPKKKNIPRTYKGVINKYRTTFYHRETKKTITYYTDKLSVVQSDIKELKYKASSGHIQNGTISRLNPKTGRFVKWKRFGWTRKQY